jgi:glutamate synthase domain-containing protein 2
MRLPLSKIVVPGVSSTVSRHPLHGVQVLRCLSSSTGGDKASLSSSSSTETKDHWDDGRVSGYSGHNFPDFVERWNRDAFYRVGYGLGGTTAAAAIATALLPAKAIMIPTTLTFGALTAVYWKIGLSDMKQTSHAVRRNYPVLGNIRYVLETVRPEIRQYFVEDDMEGRPMDRMRRSLVYQRSKNVDDTLAFGTRRDVYAPHYEWACHSMFPKPPVPWDDAVSHASAHPRRRTWIGTREWGTTKPYSASLLNISAMSYGAISDNAILALNNGARMGHFFHVSAKRNKKTMKRFCSNFSIHLVLQNTGEGGVSDSHKKGGGDLVWNIGTGYFGCGRTLDGGKRVFDEALFQETIHENQDCIRMIEIKLSQGAKPGHGGILPLAKITPEIAEARKLPFPPESDCHSPSSHSAFSNPREMIEFIVHVRALSEGLPVGIKLCVGDPRDIAALVRAMVEMNNGPDFITVDGAEGGTGAAPPEYSNSVGLPLEEGLVVVRNLLTGAGLRSKVRINASGKVMSGFSLVRTLAMGADITCAARAFMLSLGCIQALKCNTNKCPTGIATQNKELQFGLDPADKSQRVFNFHRKTLQAAAEIVGTMGHDHFSDVSGECEIEKGSTSRSSPWQRHLVLLMISFVLLTFAKILTASDIMRRLTQSEIKTLEDYLPNVEPESLLHGQAPRALQILWDSACVQGEGVKRQDIHWIY